MKNGSLHMASLRDNLSSHVNSLITNYREGLSEIILKEHISPRKTFHDLSAPCQIVVLHSELPAIDCILITHFKDEPDRDVHIYETKSYMELFTVIEETLLNDPLCLKCGRSDVEATLANILNYARQYNILTVPVLNGILSETPVSGSSNASVLFLGGCILNIDTKTIATDFVQRDKLLLTARRTSVATDSDLMLDGLGGYLYPPIWIGSSDEQPFIQKTFGYLSWQSSIVEFKTEYNGMAFFISRDGFLSVATKDRRTALSLFNTFGACLLVLSKTPVETFRENDIGDATFGAGGIISRFGGRNMMLPYEFWRKPSYVKREAISQAVMLATQTVKNPAVQSALTLWLEAHTNVQNSEWKQTLLISWIIVEEIYLADMWSRLIEAKLKTGKQRRRKLEHYNPDLKLEVLNLCGALSNDRFQSLMEFKTVRNGIIHKGKEPEKETAEKYLSFTAELVREYLSNLKLNLGVITPTGQ